MAPSSNDNGARVDPRAPRFGQAMTASLLGIAVVLGEATLVYLVAGILALAVVSGWHIDLYGLLWRYGIVPVVGRPDSLEAAAPHRFAKLLGAAGTAAASVLLVVGQPLVGFAIAGGVTALAALAATTGICLGCRMYRQMSILQRHNVV